MHEPSGGQLAKIEASGYARWIACITRPTARPMQAPMTSVGKNMPAGIEAPKVTAVRSVLAKAVTSKTMMSDIVLDGLHGFVSDATVSESSTDALADAIDVFRVVAVLEEVLDELGGGHAREVDEIADDGSKDGECSDLGDRPLVQAGLAAEALPCLVDPNEESAPDATHHA